MRIYEDYLERLEFPSNFIADVKLQWLLSWLNSENLYYITLLITKGKIISAERKNNYSFL